MESNTHNGCVNLGSLTSALPVIPYQKLTDLHYLSKGGFGTVFKGQHSDWRTTVAIKCLKIDSPVGERDRGSLLREAEVLHKARFNYIIQIFGVCNEPEFFCIVTEYMCNGSLDRLLHERHLYPQLHWSLRLRILHEIALGVNFLHNMSPPLLHHDLKTQNILLDAEFHVKIADFGLSKWRQLSISKGSGSKPTEMGGTIIYMPPEEYQPDRSRKTDVKYDMYSFAIIMWEVLSRQIPFEDATNPMQIMFCVMHGTRPDTGPASLPYDTPDRDTLVDLMTSGWSAEPDRRPTFLKCVMELGPMLRRYDHIDFLEAVLEIKKSERSVNQPVCETAAAEVKSMQFLKESPIPWPDVNTSSGSCSSQDTDISQPGALTSIIAPSAKDLSDTLECPAPLEDPSPVRDMNSPRPPDPCLQTARPMKSQPCGEVFVPVFQTHADHLAAMPTLPEYSEQVPNQPSLGAPRGPAASWMTSRREEIVENMTEACLNQSLDALLSRSLMMREDYELVVNQPTRTARVRQLLDTAHRQSEGFCCLVVLTLYKNRQNRLQPYPVEVVSLIATATIPSAPTLSLGYTAPRRR